MKKRLLTVAVSTREALEEALRENDPVLYVTAELYLGMHGSIRALMEAHGYAQGLVGCRGVFFISGREKYDPEDHALYDPFADVWL